MKIKITPLDKLFSELIRRRALQRIGGCEWCGKPKFDIQKEDGSVLPAWKQLDCAHFIGRGCRAVRHDPDNAIGVCRMGCHTAMDNNPLAKVDFFRELLGEEGLDMLRKRAETIVKLDEMIIWLYLQEQIREVK